MHVHMAGAVQTFCLVLSMSVHVGVWYFKLSFSLPIVCVVFPSLHVVFSCPYPVCSCFHFYPSPFKLVVPPLVLCSCVVLSDLFVSLWWWCLLLSWWFFSSRLHCTFFAFGCFGGWQISIDA